MLRIIADENIALAKEAFSPLAEVELLPGREISSHHLRKADVLLVRSITTVDRNLLQNTPIQFVGTATIGTDHIDTAYLREAGIVYASAAGCNAVAVAEYVLTAIARLAIEKAMTFSNSTIGIVGAGNIGKRVMRMAHAIGMEVLRNDPPLQRLTGSPKYRDLDALMEADFLTLHVPLNMKGVDKTCHLFDNNRLQKLRSDTVLINTSRGPVIDNKALLHWAKKHRQAKLILDVWENEPGINVELLARTSLGTPHIAGYSLEGKINGTQIIYQALCRHLGRSHDWQPAMPAIEDKTIHIRGGSSIEQALFAATKPVYDMAHDDAELRKIIDLPETARPGYFDNLRKNYPLRREFRNYTVRIEPMDSNLAKVLSAFGFFACG
jgi:erythronate-4-phosphate dehydrogenase